MHYYWPVLDYAKWLFGAAGAVCFLAMLPTPVGEKRGYLKLAGCLLLALGVGCAGTAGALFNLRAPHVEVTGAITGISVQGGKGASTSFLLEDNAGHVHYLSLDRAVRGLHEHQLASVIYQEGSNVILRLEPGDGRVVEGNDGSLGSWCALIAAIILAIYGVGDWRYDGTAIPAERDDDEASPDGDVDTKSMLHLSSEKD